MADEVILEFLARQLDRVRDRHRVLEDQKTVLTRSMTELRDMYRMLERLEHRDASPKGSEMTGDPPADRIDASLEELRARNAWLILRVANLRAAVETVLDATAYGDFMHDFCEQVLAADDKNRKLGCGRGEG
jgi:beta-phosphoglucomutase-like phosphatase (HAD superfamily)